MKRVQKQMQQAGQQMQQGDKSGASESMGQMSEQMQQSDKGAGSQSREALENVRSARKQQLDGMNRKQADERKDGRAQKGTAGSGKGQGDGQVSTDEEGQARGQGRGEGQGQAGQGQDDSKGQGQGQGKGDGQGEGQQGAGQGSGSPTTSTGNPGGNAQEGGEGFSLTPGEAVTQNAGGQAGAGGVTAGGGTGDATNEERIDAAPAPAEWVKSQWDGTPEGVANVIRGGSGGERSSREWAEVHANYSAIAESAVDREEIPLTRRDYIRSYFEAIRPE